MQLVVIDYDKETNPPAMKDTYMTPRRYTYQHNPYRHSLKEAMEHSIFISEDAHRVRERFALRHSNVEHTRRSVASDRDTQSTGDRKETLEKKKGHEREKAARLAKISEDDDDGGQPKTNAAPSFVTQVDQKMPPKKKGLSHTQPIEKEEEDAQVDQKLPTKKNGLSHTQPIEKEEDDDSETLEKKRRKQDERTPLKKDKLTPVVKEKDSDSDSRKHIHVHSHGHGGGHRDSEHHEKDKSKHRDSDSSHHSHRESKDAKHETKAATTAGLDDGHRKRAHSVPAKDH